MTFLTSHTVLVLLFVTLTYARPQLQSQDQQSTVQPIAILSHENTKTEDGYKYNFESENGIRIQEEATFEDIPRINIRGTDTTQDDGPSSAIVARGSYSYTAPDGTPINLSYVADQNGFRPVGDHLPTPPPIPDIIQRAIALLPQEYKGENEQQ